MAPDARPERDGRAVLSLTLGVLSFVTLGLTGLPAIVLGLASRGAIRDSNGALRGERMAAVGVATGFAGTLLSLVAMATLVVGFLVQSGRAATHREPLFTPSPESTTAWAPAAPAMPREPMTIGSIHVVDLDPNGRAGFHQQLAGELRRAASAHETVILMTTAKWCGVCREIQTALPDPRMQAALENVDLVRVDVDDFDDELKASGMLEPTLPWFYKLDVNLRPVDAISAGEWDDNVPQNMAPVLGAFLSGTLGARREPHFAGGGTYL
jgi:hypothetical protein